MENLIAEYRKRFIECAEDPALTDYSTGKTYTYRQLAARIAAMHDSFRSLGIEQGDKIALIGKNSIEWISLYMSVITYGSVIVPILADFNPKDVAGIVNHSDAKLLYGDKALLSRLDISSLEHVKAVTNLEDIPDVPAEDFDANSLSFAKVNPDDVVVISYTSGTTGSSKGVMLPERSLRNNAVFAIDHDFHFRHSRVLALLPLAHAYGCAFDLITPLSTGSHIYVLGKTPTPATMMAALAQVKPHLICAVPLVMEKIVTKTVLPKLKKAPVSTLIRIPLVNRLIFKKIRQQMLAAFGGCIKEVNMGGAALAPEVEKFLRRIKFPFTVGYGMTECGPLISYDTWRDFKPGSCGTILPGMEARIDCEGYNNGMGEICVRGVNVMLGYYKNPEATSAAIVDGWLRTGDVGYKDEHGTLFIRGRSKAMILTSAGQNIYPEEIESKLNSLKGVTESLVYEQDGLLKALVIPEKELMENMDEEAFKSAMLEDLRELNSLVAPYEKLSEIQICGEPFEKTPKQSIKRFLYPKMAKIISGIRL